MNHLQRKKIIREHNSLQGIENLVEIKTLLNDIEKLENEIEIEIDPVRKTMLTDELELLIIMLNKV